MLKAALGSGDERQSGQRPPELFVGRDQRGSDALRERDVDHVVERVLVVAAGQVPGPLEIDAAALQGPQVE
jgi:hypothetical protein